MHTFYWTLGGFTAGWACCYALYGRIKNEIAALRSDISNVFLKK